MTEPASTSTPAPSPTLAALRDCLLNPLAALTAAEALASARTLLAAHARELATLVQQRIDQDIADNPGCGRDDRNHIRRGGMMTARQTLDRYADQLDQQTAPLTATELTAARADVAALNAEFPDEPQDPTTGPAVLPEAERTFLAFALDLAFDRMVSDDGFTDEDEVAYASLRKLAGGES